MATDNLGLVYYGKDDIRLESRPVPKPGDEDVLIRVSHVGICGSDISYVKRGVLGNLRPDKPIILGHESSGTVVQCGKNVKHLKEGDRVAIEPGFRCYECKFCYDGRYHLCTKGSFHQSGEDGSMSRLHVQRASFCYKIPDNMSLQEGAFMEPLSVALWVCKKAQITIDSTVLITGAGTIGLGSLLVTKLMGASKICVTDISKTRLEMAKKLGADVTVHVDTPDVDVLATKVREALGRLPDITLECSGTEPGICLAIKATENGGKLVLGGLSGPEVKIPLSYAAIREVDLIGVFRYPNCYNTAIDLVASGRLDVKPLITHTFKLEDALKAFDAACSRSDGVIKVQVQCNGY
ncbi:sorbitol dehydrogenase-like [Oratosquilla oratoria]|uniref:sorbitol dehydrogenase-like n=1 Tax=Oratosquilla oratoria TaxID=337810 RepID=UPI003F76DCF3